MNRPLGGGQRRYRDVKARRRIGDGSVQAARPSLRFGFGKGYFAVSDISSEAVGGGAAAADNGGGDGVPDALSQKSRKNPQIQGQTAQSDSTQQRDESRVTVSVWARLTAQPSPAQPSLA